LLDVTALLEEAPTDPPCGPNLEYDPEFLELEQVSRGKPEQQFGETIIPAEEPNWADVRSRAESLLKRSKDLRVAALMVRALLHTEGFAGLESGTALIRELLERYWDKLHPELDPDDGDATMRMNALAVLADGGSLLRDLRMAPLVRTRQGQLLVRDIEIARNALAPRAGETPLTESHINGFLAAAAAAGDFSAASVGSTIDSWRGLARLLNERVGSDRAPDLQPVTATLRLVQDVVAAAVPEAGAGGEGQEGEAGAAAGGGAGPGRLNVAAGEVGSRQDALALVDKIISYFERHEPSNPAPLLLKRAKRLMTMNFVDIIKDLVPDGMDRIETIAGITHEE